LEFVVDIDRQDQVDQLQKLLADRTGTISLSFLTRLFVEIIFRD